MLLLLLLVFIVDVFSTSEAVVVVLEMGIESCFLGSTFWEVLAAGSPPATPPQPPLFDLIPEFSLIFRRFA